MKTTPVGGDTSEAYPLCQHGPEGGGTYPTLCIREPTPMLDYRPWYMRFPEGGTLSTGDPPPQDGAEV